MSDEIDFAGPNSQTTMHEDRRSSEDGAQSVSQGPPKQEEAGMLTSSAPISVVIDPISLILTECITVTSAMRKHARWAHSSVSAILAGGNASYSFDNARNAAVRPSSVAGTSPHVRNSAGKPLNNDVPGNLANRWGLRGKKGKSMQDNPLMSSFARLRSDLAGCKDIRQFDTPSLLQPFLQVVRSSSTSAPITSLALIAITKFFAYNIISKESPRLSLAMQLLSSAITHCRFEASDSAADEIVLLRILKLMEIMMSGPGGDLLGDESVCEMMETGLSMCCQTRLSELLRRSAEMSMVAMCQVIFERLKYLEAEAEGVPGGLEETTRDVLDTVKMDPSTNDNTVSTSQENNNEGRASASFDERTELTESVQPSQEANLTQLSSKTSESDAEEVRPYSLPSIRELFRVLVDLLDPHDRQHTDTMRVMAMRIIDVAFEVSGPSIAKHPSLATLTKDNLCRHLFQLVRSDNMAILNESLRVAGTLLATCRGVLKLQQELFLSYLVTCLHPRVEIPQEIGIDPALYEGVPKVPKLARPTPSQSNSGRSTPVPVKERQRLGMEGGSRKPDAREAMVESIAALARIPSFMVELYVNYDCDVDRADLCEDMVGLLSRNAFPDSATWSTTNVPPLCLDALLGYVQFIFERLDQSYPAASYPDREKLKEQRLRKKIIIRGAEKFNENPKAGIAFLAAQGIIQNPDDPRSITSFLKGTSRVSKKVLGEYISKRSNEHILSAFLDHFDFTGKRVDEALREMLESFRLPGESPLIERIVTVFSEKYSSTTPEGIANKDAVYILTYAIIMLNTDQHNPNVKSQNRMSFADFSRNLRGVNDGQDFAPEYLQKIYDSIKTHEIILPDEHDNKHAFDYAWRELLVKTESAADLIICDTNIFDADMFAATWKPVVATLSYVFMSATDDAVFSRVVAGFDQCARIATAYHLTEALDHIIFCLSSMCTLAGNQIPNTSLNTEVQAGETSVMVSEMAVGFGRDFKAQLATVVLFRVVTGSEPVVRKGWKYIIRIWLNLFVNSLLPPFAPELSEQFRLSPIPLQTPSQVIDREQRSNDSGLFSAFTSYLTSYAADEPPEPSDEEIESTLCTVDCVSACYLQDIFSKITQLPLEGLESFIEALLLLLPEDQSSAVIVVKPEVPPENPTKSNGFRHSQSQVAYDPTMVFILEISTLLTLRDEQTRISLGAKLAEVLQAVVRDPKAIHPIVLSRAVFYLLCLLNATHEDGFIRVPVVLHTISSFDQDILEKVSKPLLDGIRQCIKEPGPLRNEMTTSPDFFSILERLHTSVDPAPQVFDCLIAIAGANPSAITADNYEAIISLLNKFATAGSVGSVSEQRQDLTARKGKPNKPAKSSNTESVARGVKSINSIYQLSGRVPTLIAQSHLEQNEAWATYWSPIFQALSTQCVNPCREIRNQALTTLQRSLLSPEIISKDHEGWTAIFGEVLFPLINRLLKPEVFQSDPIGMSETRVQVATLLCKVFLHYLVYLSKWEGMLDLWLRILDVMDRLMNSGQGDNLEEAVPESLKNVLLVMSSGGYLVPPQENQQHTELWEKTWQRLERFLPGLFAEIFASKITNEQSENREQAVTKEVSSSEG